MPSPEPGIQLDSNVGWADVDINDLAAGLPALSREWACHTGADRVREIQKARLARVRRGEASILCPRCGTERSGAEGLLGRGSRDRKLRTSTGMLRFRLLQVSCRDCRKTWCPSAELLGLRPRQRYTEELERKLVEGVTEQSYAKTCALAGAWLGSTLSPRTLHRCVQARGHDVVFTPAQECAVVQADGTKVPAGRSRYGTDVRIAFQILAHPTGQKRNQVTKRIAGWSMGPGGWAAALPAGIASETIVTDREAGIPEAIQAQHPGVRHQLCEWHLGHTAKHLMTLDHVPVPERVERVSELGRILWGAEDPAEKRTRYADFFRRLGPISPRAAAMLRSSLGKILYDVPSAERTTSVAEREMREINRRTDVGVQWSVRGVDHLLKLRFAKRLNPDDFERVWSEVRAVPFHLVPPA
jgi:Transposase, Mutator family